MPFKNLYQSDKSSKYVPLEEGSESGDQLHVSSGVSSTRLSVSRLFYFTSLLLYATFPVLLITIFALYGKLQAAWMNQGFLEGFPTELDPIKSSLGSETIQFTGGLHYHKNGSFYREVIEGQPHYVGEPSPEIDSAWDSLLKGQFISLAGDEATSMVGRTWKDDYGKYEFALDVMHTLHCVNKLRKALDPDYYEEKETKSIHRMHVDHCLDYLRQTLQCHGDVTPIVFSWSDNAKKVVPGWREPHTCRDFSRIRHWAEARYRH